MTSIFLSYRRDDSRHQSGRLHDHLMAHFGPSQVFKDVDSIPLGSDFREVLTERVAACDVFLAVIGDGWLGAAGSNGVRRLDDPGDFVRIEVEAALSRKIPVIPVLVGNASVPQADELPESLRGLSFRHGITIRPDPDFHGDMDRLIRGIEAGVAAIHGHPKPHQGSAEKTSARKFGRPTTGQQPKSPNPPSRPPVVPVAQPPGRRTKIPLIGPLFSLISFAVRTTIYAVGAVVGLLFLIFLYAFAFPTSDPSPEIAPPAIVPTTNPGPPPGAALKAGESPRPVVEAPPQVDGTILTNSLGMKLKRIPAGEFLMGSDDSDPDARDDEKVNGKKHLVTITGPLYLGTTEVTVGQFRQFVDRTNFQTDAEKDGQGGSGWNESNSKIERDPKYTWRSPGFPQTDDHPVTNVSWNDAVAFCDWLSKAEAGRTYRLPTEAEWEYCCRANQSTRFSSGNDAESLVTVGNVADESARAKMPDLTLAIKANDGYVFTAPVGRFLPNAFGLFDMHGNVNEWCSDYFDENYNLISPATVPQNSIPPSERVVRGGSWIQTELRSRPADRSLADPKVQTCTLGFRVALTDGKQP